MHRIIEKIGLLLGEYAMNSWKNKRGMIEITFEWM